jgi:hypothetical protein
MKYFIIFLLIILGLIFLPLILALNDALVRQTHPCLINPTLLQKHHTSSEVYTFSALSLHKGNSL